VDAVSYWHFVTRDSFAFSALLLMLVCSSASRSQFSFFMFTECTVISTLGLSLSGTVLHSLNSVGEGAATHGKGEHKRQFQDRRERQKFT
jgi:hypothetical protein